MITRKLTRLYRGVHDISDSLEGDADDICKIRHWQEQLSDFKSELAEIRNSLLSMDLEDYDGLNKQQSEVENRIFNVSLKAKRLLESRSAAADSKGIKLPKLEIPTFNGDILSWLTFWEQFCVSVHDRTNLSDSVVVG